MTRVTGVLLAGGASRRFGRHKLLVALDGAPLFEHALRALATVCDEVIVVLAPEGSDLTLPSLAPRVRIVRDALAHGGPLLGALTGLRVARGTYALVAGADMPGLRPELLGLMLRRLEATERDALVLADAEGPRPLPLAVRVSAAAALAETLGDGGERRLRALVAGLGAEILGEAEWASADPDGAWRQDVDLPEDLPGKGRPA